VKIRVAVTDGDWFRVLRERGPDEVNFWQPSGSRTFRALELGEPFLFKPHSPENYIVGAASSFGIAYCRVRWSGRRSGKRTGLRIRGSLSNASATTERMPEVRTSGSVPGFARTSARPPTSACACSPGAALIRFMASL
jgi:hypothetical protein